MLFILFSISLIIIGGAITIFSWWLLLHISDRRVLRFMRSPFKLRVSNIYRETNVALAAVIIMIIGMIILGAGVVGLFGLANK
jgi:hypothetical protein